MLKLSGESRHLRLRFLAVAHIVVGLLLVLGCLELGAIVVPFILWFRVPFALLPLAAVAVVIVSALRLWNSTADPASALRSTRRICLISLVVGGGLCLWGIVWMQAERERAGGLLQGLWWYPLATGVTLTVLSATSLYLASHVPRRGGIGAPRPRP